jgi:hypothetical protein
MYSANDWTAPFAAAIGSVALADFSGAGFTPGIFATDFRFI